MRIKASFSSLLLVLLITSCNNYSKIEITNIESLSLKVGEGESVNYGLEFNAKVLAHFKNGNAEDISGHPNLTLESQFFRQTEDSKLMLIAKPFSFEDTSYAVHLILVDEFDSVQSKDQVKLNYQGSIVVLPSTFPGQDGIDAQKGGNTLFGRDGADGKQGQNGADGDSGDNYTAHIWKEDNEIKMMLEDDSTGVRCKYKSLSCDSIFINISGANGGNGGKGGDGGNGKDGKSIEKGGKLPGNGGNGGNGGDGGNGGNGGSIIIFLHPNAAHLRENIFVQNHGGNAGMMGLPGLGGDPGATARGQKQGDQGEVGNLGLKGKDGLDGPNPVVSIIAFEI